MVKKYLKASYAIFRKVNASIWGGVEAGEKAGKIVKTGLSGADIVIGTSHALEDLQCNDYVCASIDVIGSVSSAVGLVLGNIPATKSLTTITGSVTVGCRAIRFYCKSYGAFWGCTVFLNQGIEKGANALSHRIEKGAQVILKIVEGQGTKKGAEFIVKKKLP
jgi:hypothetical protein